MHLVSLRGLLFSAALVFLGTPAFADDVSTTAPAATTATAATATTTTATTTTPAPAKPAPVATTRPPSTGLVSPAWFYMGLAASTVAGALTVLSEIDAQRKHDRFADAGCAPGAVGPIPADCEARASAGDSAQTRTNLLLGATAILTVTTAALGVLVVQVPGGGSARVAFGPGQANLVVRTP